MNRRLSHNVLLLLSFSLILGLAENSQAQSPERTRERPRETGSLVIYLERERVRTMLQIPVKLEQTVQLKQALQRSFNFPLTIDPPRKNARPRRETAGHESEQMAFTVIEAQGHTEPRLLSNLRIEPAPLAKELKSLGVQNLMVMLVPLKSKTNLHVSGLEAEGFLTGTYYQGEIDTANPTNIDLTWGYQRSDLAIQAVPVFLYFLVPIILIIWKGTSVLKMKDRPAEMWGTYFRFLAGTFNAIWFFWFPVYAWANLGEIMPPIIGPAAGPYWRLIEPGLFVAPPMIMMWLCHLISHRVYRHVRGAEWTPAAVVNRSIVASSLAFLPLLGVMLGLSSGSGGLRQTLLTLLLLIAATFLAIALFRKTLRSSVYSVTSGELRNRVFELAGRAGVTLSQIFVVPDGKAQLSNAFARSDNAVMLTASLLRRLSKREVDAIIGHEIGHLKEKHPHHRNKIAAGLWIASFVVATTLVEMVDSERWLPAILSFTFAGAIAILHCISRGNERRADAIGVELTGDPEAFISGLSKLEKLNLMPMHGGGMFEFGTHPRSLRRLEDIGRRFHISPERMRVLLAGEEPPDDQYRFDQINQFQTKLFSTEFKRAYVLKVSLTILGALILVPVALGLLLSQAPQGVTGYLAGLLAAWLILHAVRNFMLALDFGSLERRFRDRISQQGLEQAAREGIFVGLAPGAQLRRYEALTFWDVGLLWFVDDRMFYIGEETRFELRRRQVQEIRLAALDPAPIHRKRLVVTWRDEKIERGGAFYVTIPRSIFQNRREMSALERRINAWLNEASAPAQAAAATPELELPTFGAITAAPAKVKFNPGLTIRLSLKLAFAGALVSFLFRLPFWNACYAVAVLVLLAVADELPKLYYGGLMVNDEPEPQPAYQRGAWMESGAMPESHG